MAFTSALARQLGYLATLLLILTNSATAINLAELGLHAQDLNTTDLNDVRAFISHWEVLSRGNTKGRQYPPLASQVPVLPIFEIGKVRRQEDPSCTWRGGGFCLGDGKCCGPVDNGWCCPGSEFCCQGGSSTGCCGSDGFCCGSETGFDAGECCSRGQTCCVPTTPPLATIIGASVGGSLGLILIALISFCLFWRRYRNKVATAAATSHHHGPPFMLPSEHSVSPPGLSSTPGTRLGRVTHARAELHGGRSPYPSPAAPNTQFGYQPFDHYNQEYYVPSGNHPQDVPEGMYPSQDRYRGQMLELRGVQGLNNEQPGQAPRTS